MMNRRDVLAGISALGVSSILGRAARAEAEPAILSVTRRTLEVKGKAASVYGITGPNGRPGHEMLLGERFRLRVKNDTGEDTILHWHGSTK